MGIQSHCNPGLPDETYQTHVNINRSSEDVTVLLLVLWSREDLTLASTKPARNDRKALARTYGVQETLIVACVGCTSPVAAWHAFPG